MKLALDIEGVKPEEIERGLAAARRVFAAADVTPETAARGYAALQAWDDAGFPEDFALYGADEAYGADVWHDAEVAALDACCPDRWERGIAGSLVLLDSAAH